MAAIATIATLLYLAIQVSQNSQVVGTSNYWQLSSQFGEFSQQLSQDEKLMEIHLRGIKDFQSLSEIDQARFHMVISNLFTKYQLMTQLVPLTPYENEFSLNMAPRTWAMGIGVVVSLYFMVHEKTGGAS